MAGDTYGKGQQKLSRKVEELSRAVDAVKELILRIKDAADTADWYNRRSADPADKANGEGYVEGLRCCIRLLEDADPLFGDEDLGGSI